MNSYVSTYTKFTRDVGLVAATNFLLRLTGFITLPIVSKTLGASGYGIWAQLIIVLSLVRPLTTLGLPFALVRFLAGEKDRKKIQDRFFSVTIFVVALSLVVSLVLVLLSPLLASALLGEGEDLLKIIALAIPFQGMLSVMVSYFRAFRQIKLWAIFNIVEGCGQVGLIAYFVLSGYGLLGIAYSVLIIRVVLCLLGALLIIPRLGVTLPTFSGLGEHLRFGVPTIPQNLSSWVVNSSDRLVIGFFLGAAFVGYYVPGYAMGEIIRMFFFPFALLLPPVLSKLYDENNISEVKTHLSYSLKYFLMLAIPSAFGLSLISKEFLLSLSTPEIAANGYIITPIVASGVLLYGIYIIFLQVLFMVKKTKIIGISWIIASTVNFGLNLVIVPLFGIIGAAVTTLFAFALALGITVYYSSRELTFPIDKGFILKSLAASVVMSLVIWVVNPHGIVNILLMVAAGTVIYFIGLFLLRGFSRGELAFFRNLLLRRTDGR